MAESLERKFDVVVFGATGFTGQFVVEELARVTEKDESLKWAVAGRNKSKLDGILEQTRKETGLQLENVEVIIADVMDEESMAKLCQQAKLVMNCVGPYRFWGEQVVKACVENGAHHLDISGEPQFLENMHLKYHDMAKEKNVYVVGSCGFDSIPADMGVQFLREKFPGELTTVESYLSFESGPKGASLHYATWQSAIHGFADQASLKKIRKELNPKPLPRMEPRLPKRGAVFFNPEVGKYCLPFLGADASVVRRTQRYQYETEEKRPLNFGAYFTVSGLLYLIPMMLVGVLFGILAKYKFGRDLLEKYPKLFSLGYVTHEGPTKEQMATTSFSMTFFGEGFSNKGEDLKKNDMKMVTKVVGPEPGYVATPIAIVQAGLTLLSEPEALPESGGVYPPGAMFAKTKLIENLDKNGMKFTVVSEAKEI